MLFPYQCSKCGNRFDGDFAIGKAPRGGVPCPSCGGIGKRIYEGMSISVKVGSFSRPSTFGEQRKQENIRAAKRMKGRKAPVRLEGYRMADGKVVEAAGV